MGNFLKYVGGFQRSWKCTSGERKSEIKKSGSEWFFFFINFIVLWDILNLCVTPLKIKFQNMYLYIKQ